MQTLLWILLTRADSTYQIQGCVCNMGESAWILYSHQTWNNLILEAEAVLLSNTTQNADTWRKTFLNVSFQTSLNKLLETLGRAEPFFIRCIRSNAEKVRLPQSWAGCWDPGLEPCNLLISTCSLSLCVQVKGNQGVEGKCTVPTTAAGLLRLSLTVFCCLLQKEMLFDESLVLQQLRYTGMLETVRIRRSGYSAKYTFQVWWQLEVDCAFRNICSLRKTHLVCLFVWSSWPLGMSCKNALQFWESLHGKKL